MHIHHCAPRPTPPGWQPGVAFTSEAVELNDPVRRYNFMPGVSIQVILQEIGIVHVLILL